jgi:DNA-binding response OmpR family regulator
VLTYFFRTYAIDDMVPAISGLDMEPTFRNPSQRFGAFEVDLRSGELQRHGIRVELQEQPFQVLVILLEHPATLAGAPTTPQL